MTRGVVLTIGPAAHDDRAVGPAEAEAVRHHTVKGNAVLPLARDGDIGEFGIELLNVGALAHEAVVEHEQGVDRFLHACRAQRVAGQRFRGGERWDGAAEDLAQEVFLKAFRNLRSYDPGRKLSSWLFKIAHNATIDHLRRGGVDTVALEGSGEDEVSPAAYLADTASENPAAAAERRDMARALERAIAGLRPEYREAVVLRYVEGLAYEEIGDTMGLPIGTIKTFLHRARKALAGVMRDAGWAPESPGEPRRGD